MSQKKKTEKKTEKKTPQPGRDERGRFTKENKIGEEQRFEKDNAAACKYQPEYADKLLEFFGQPATRVEFTEIYNGKGQVVKRTPVVVPNEYPTFEAFAASLGVCVNTLKNWCEESRRFANAYTRAKEMQKGKLITNTLGGMYNPMFAKFEAVNNHGMSDKVATDSTVTLDVKYSDEIDEESN